MPTLSAESTSKRTVTSLGERPCRNSKWLGRMPIVMNLTKAERRILRALVEHGPCDYRRLAAALGKGRPTSHGSIAKQLETLRQIGCVAVCGPEVGLPSRRFAPTDAGLEALGDYFGAALARAS